MTPPMYMRLKDLFVDEGLTAGFKVQWRQWRDTGKDTDQFIVFRSSGGTDITFDLGGDWYVMVDVILEGESRCCGRRGKRHCRVYQRAIRRR